MPRKQLTSASSRPSLNLAGPRPFVLVNMAMTADGKIGTANRSITSFGSPKDYQNLLALRATADAVMSGARTIDTAPVTLGPGEDPKWRKLRLKNGLKEYNLRVIVSGSGSINPDAEIFRHRFSPIILLTSARVAKRRLNQLKQRADVIGQFGKDSIDFVAGLRWLKQEFGINRLLCEGGGELNSALFQARLVDELHLTICPLIFGGAGSPTIADGDGIPALQDAVQLTLRSRRMAGNEMFLVYRVKSPDQTAGAR